MTSSCFLFGPRATGKTSLLKAKLKNSNYIDLLNDDTFEELMRRPVTLSEKIKDKKQIVIIDEIQKLPKLFGSLTWNEIDDFNLIDLPPQNWIL